MNYLLDVNVLLAWGWADHADHRRTALWIATMKKKRGAKLLTSAIPELGFVRVSVQRSAGRLRVNEAAATLSSMLHSLGTKHEFIPDSGSSAKDFPQWCVTASNTTDAHLFSLAQDHGAELATLDTGIPGGFLLPHG
ncbi:MAG: PIN domain-containing protein [Verrucomicrobiota bacterium]